MAQATGGFLRASQTLEARLSEHVGGVRKKVGSHLDSAFSAVYLRAEVFLSVELFWRHGRHYLSLKHEPERSGKGCSGS